MKRMFKLVLILLCCAMLFGCSNAGSKAGSQTSDTSKQQDIIELLTTAKTAKVYIRQCFNKKHDRGKVSFIE